MQLLSGNEAIAQGAWEAGARIGVGYPGTPSTETMESFGAKENVYAEWCANEKVAVEVAMQNRILANAIRVDESRVEEIREKAVDDVRRIWR